MEKLGFFEGREDRDIPLAHSDRSKTPIEPYLSDQWFVKMESLAQTAIDAVNDGRVTFFPERYKNTYLDWLGEKRDWCISRQLWWGHRIPVWRKEITDADKLIKMELIRTLEKKIESIPTQVLGFQDAASHAEFVHTRAYLEEGKVMALVCVAPGHDDFERELESRGFEQDPDVLDTWFSSALWPHSTLGWPGDTPELRYYYPTSVLVTSRDIITLWVARMVMTGIYNVGKIPFHHVYIHTKMLDGFGETMSKSKGNGIDPLDIIERYGADALRFQMAFLATENQDSRMAVANVCPHCDALVPVKQEHMYMRTRKVTCPNCKKPFRPGGPWPAADPELPTAKQASERFEIGRNFANKMWNAARFLLLNLEGYTPAPLPSEGLPIEDRWILSRLATTTAAVTGHLEGYRFSEAIRTIYDFTWSEYCDWYVEMSKGRLRKDEGGRMKDEPAAEGSGAPDHPSSFILHPSQRALVQRVLVGVLDAVLRLVQPVMPFVAESIWQALGQAAPHRGLPLPTEAAESVVIAPWPVFPEVWKDAAMEARMARMQELVAHGARGAQPLPDRGADAAGRERALPRRGGRRLPGAGAVHRVAGRRGPA